MGRMTVRETRIKVKLKVKVKEEKGEEWRRRNEDRHKGKQERN